jgi:uncharacterized membrane protein
LDIVAIALLTLATIPVVMLTEGPIRTILGLLVLLIFPGYALMVALFPAKKSLGAMERAGVTIAFSFATASLGGLILNYTPWGVKLTPVVVSTALIVFVSSMIALLRRARLPESDRFLPGIHFQVQARWKALTRVDRVLNLALAFAVLSSTGVFAYVIARPKAQEKFTDFYVLGPHGQLADYPVTVRINENVEATLGLANHEKETVSYSVDVVLDDQPIQTIGPVQLTDGSDWSSLVTLKASLVADNQTIDFLLHKNQQSDTYLKLRMWLDVKP